MGKQPAFQFYPADWLKDPAVQAASSATRGAWMNLLCRMWESETRGVIVGTSDQIRKLAGCDKDEWETILAEIKDLKIAIVQEFPQDFRTISVTSRRMVTDQKQRENWRKQKVGQRTFREKTESVHPVSVDCPPLSSSSSSSSTSKPKPSPTEKVIPRTKQTDDEWLESIRANPAYRHIDLDRELCLMDAWLSTRPSRKKTRRFIVAWLNRVEKPVEGGNGTSKSVVQEWAAERGVDIGGVREGDGDIRSVFPALSSGKD